MKPTVRILYVIISEMLTKVSKGHAQVGEDEPYQEVVAVGDGCGGGGGDGGGSVVNYGQTGRNVAPGSGGCMGRLMGKFWPTKNGINTGINRGMVAIGDNRNGNVPSTEMGNQDAKENPSKHFFPELHAAVCLRSIVFPTNCFTGKSAREGNVWRLLETG